MRSPAGSLRVGALVALLALPACVYGHRGPSQSVMNDRECTRLSRQERQRTTLGRGSEVYDDR